MNHIPPYLFLSREDDDDVRDIGKHDFRLVLLYPTLSNANRTEQHNYLALTSFAVANWVKQNDNLYGSPVQGKLKRHFQNSLDTNFES